MREPDNARVVKLVLVALAIATFAGAASMRILDPLLPLIAQRYGRNVGTAGFAITVYAVSYSCSQFIFGPLSDRLGPYRIITLSTAMSTLAALGCAWAPTLQWLLVLRFIAGGVAAAVAPLALVWISHAVSREVRSVAIARNTGASIVGTTAGQLGGGIIGQYLGWQASFFMVSALFACSCIALARLGAVNPKLRTIARSSGSHRSERFRFYAILRHVTVRWTLLAVAVEGFAMYISFTYAAASLQHRLGLVTSLTGLLIAQYGLGGIAFVLSAPYLVRSLSETARATLAGLMLGTGFMLLIVVASAIATGCVLFLIGFGFFMMHNVLQFRATTMAPERPGQALALYASTYFLAQAAGATTGGWCFDHLGSSVMFATSSMILACLGLVLGRTLKANSTAAAVRTTLDLQL